MDRHLRFARESDDPDKHHRPYAVTTPQPDLTGEVTEVAATHARALAHGHAVVCPLTDEPWGVWRFFLRDPNGKIVNIMRYQTGR